MQTLEQRRAEHAWNKCENLLSGPYKYEFGEYTNVAKGLPSLVMNSGLMQTMAFLEQKTDMHKQVGKDLREWLNERFGDEVPTDFRGFMNSMWTIESQTYQAITSETMAWLKWLRQLAAAQQR